MADLAEDREKVILAGAIAALPLSKYFSNQAKNFAAYIEKLPTTLSGRKFLSRSQRMALRKANRMLWLSLNQASDHALQDLDRVVERIARLQRAYLIQAGAKAPSIEQIQVIKKQVLKMMHTEFPVGSGLSYYDRLSKIHSAHLKQTGDILKKTIPAKEGTAKIVQDLHTGWAYSRPSKTPIKGGSAAKKLRRLVVAEENRLARETELLVLKKADIELSYWRLNANHQWVGGTEICEVHSQKTGRGVVSALRKMGVDISGIDLEGLHLMDEWPDYPHPYCACFPEPLIL